MVGTGDDNSTFCATLVDEWATLGLTDAVVCPGSRSTPMAVALADDARVRVHVHHDERSGSFLALGLARATRRPVAVLVTSGTAAVHLHAAVVEADLDHVPLLALTADRPPRLRGVGAPQTIDQLHLYGDAVRLFVDAPLADRADSGAWRPLARSVFAAAADGPVQLNLPFDEPLLGTVTAMPEPMVDAVVADRARACDPSEIEALLLARRGVIIAGDAVDDPRAVLALASRLGWPVLADPRSGCRVPHPCVVSHADALLRVDGPQHDVDAVLRFGSLPASKVVNQWIAGLDAPHLHGAPHDAIDDPHRVVSARLVAEASSICATISAAPVEAADRSWLAVWRAADDAVDAAFEHTCTALDGEPAIARAVVAAVPDGGALVVSSSMPVRDVEWFSSARRGLVVHSNRGANGIDGVVSTAVGVALAGAPTALLIGDVAFLHDTNGLLGLDRREVDLCIVVVDNDGGGIFSFLPQAQALEQARFEQLFGTPHGVDLAGLAHAHGLPVLRATDAESVGVAVRAALATGGVHVVHVVTDRAANVDVHERLNAAAAEAAAAAGWVRV